MTPNGANMLGGLTHLFASNPALLLLIPALLVIFGLILHTRHSLKISELGYNLKRAVSRWQVALEQVQDRRVLTQPDVLNHKPDEYDESSRIQYEEAQKTWATWRSQREKLEQLVTEAEQLQTRLKGASWWKFPLGKLKKSIKSLLEGPVQFSVGSDAPCELEADAFVPALLASADKSRELADSFALAFKNAADCVAKINLAVDGSSKSKDSGLVGQKNKLLAVDLTLEPYRASLDAILVSRDQIRVKVTRQPLSNYAKAVSGLLSRISSLEKDLAFACSMYDAGLATASALAELTTRIQELRGSVVPSQVPGVVFESAWSLDEEGFSPEPTIDEAVRQSAEFSLALKRGELSTLEKLDRSVRNAIGQTSRILESTMAEKACFEQKLAEITADCTEADLAADAQTRADCLKSYAAQKWALARNACETFFGAHAKRLAARAEAKRLLSRMAEITQLVSENLDVSSVGCDEEFTQLVKTTGALSDQARLGATDWEPLRQQILTVVDKNLEGGVQAFVDRLNVEIDAHAQAMAAVDRLASDLRYTDKKTRDKWGGASARTSLESVSPAIEEAIASAKPKKQSWNALTERVAAAADLLRPALSAVQEEVRRDQLEYDRLSTLSGDIESCNTAGYSRTVNGRIYGQGIYCPTVVPAQKLSAAQDHYQGRRYDDMKAALMAGRQVLITMHLDAWWLCLQTLAFSTDPSARQYAQAEGYDSCGYDEWMEVHKKRSLQGALFNLSETVEGNTQGQPFAEEAIGDAPVISDYTPGALVSK